MNFTTIYYYRSGGSIKTKKNRELPVQKTKKEREKTRWLFGAFEKLLSNILGTTHVVKQQHTSGTQEVKKLSNNNNDISLFFKKT